MSSLRLPSSASGSLGAVRRPTVLSGVSLRIDEGFHGQMKRSLTLSSRQQAIVCAFPLPASDAKRIQIVPHFSHRPVEITHELNVQGFWNLEIVRNLSPR